MLKTRIYILQFLGIILLLCCYLLRDQPDRLYVMHFDSSSKTVIKKDHSPEDIDRFATHHSVTTDHKHGHKQKTSQTRHISFELMLPAPQVTATYEPMQFISHTCMLPTSYSYLFYAEINPPPPKC